jgi:hypothetical protein
MTKSSVKSAKPAKSGKIGSSNRTPSPKTTTQSRKAPALKPMPAVRRLVRFEIGSKVSHPIFGIGVVQIVDGEKLYIVFRTGSAKWIIASFVTLL